MKWIGAIVAGYLVIGLLVGSYRVVTQRERVTFDGKTDWKLVAVIIAAHSILWPRVVVLP